MHPPAETLVDGPVTSPSPRSERRHSWVRLSLVLGVLSVVSGCGGTDSTSTVGAVRDTLPDGTPIVRYDALGTAETVVDLDPDLTLGAVDGEGPQVFGDVRGIEARPDGEIFVLDAQALEVRVFGPTGEFRRTLSRHGEGPGELGATNGMVLAADTLFVYDLRKWAILGLAVDDGRELVRYPTPVRSYGFMWQGVRDHEGRHWKEASHSDAEPVYPPQEGLNEADSRTYMKVYDPSTEASDSVLLGTRTGQWWVQAFDNGFSSQQIPFSSTTLSVVDPAGGFWRVSTDAYRIARLDASGDTTLIIEAAVPPRPVTPGDREAVVEAAAERGAEAARVAADRLEVAGSEHPVVASIFVAADRLWVMRDMPEGERTRVDAFDRDGGYRGSIRLPTGASEYLAPRVRGRHMYVLTQDDLDIAYVLRLPLPEGLSEAPTSGSEGP